jgi:tight adherence protein C
MNEALLFYVCVVGAVAAAGFFLSRLFVTGGDAKLRERLNESATTAREQTAAAAAASGEVVRPVLQRISSAAAQPFMPVSREKQSSLRRELGYAGLYSSSAAKIVTGAKVILMIGGIAFGYLAGAFIDQRLFGLALGGLLGSFLPRLWLKTKIKQNQLALNLALPDALDLMVVCVEAGLTIDAAIQRVGSELSMAHPALSRELGMAHMETRVGLSRQDALKNLGARTGSSGLQALAAMLNQADRFGTSIANALRIQADALRTKRQHAAEELAAKASVKISFPLVLFIFPATFIVLAGPLVIGLMNSALFSD